VASHPLGRAATRAASKEGLGSGRGLLDQAATSRRQGRVDLLRRKEVPALLRYADGGTLTPRVDIHQLPLAAPWVATLIEDLFGPAARGTVGVGTASGGGRLEGNPARLGGMSGRAETAFPQVRWDVAGPGFEPG
jgi:hypothetical protein